MIVARLEEMFALNKGIEKQKFHFYYAGRETTTIYNTVLLSNDKMQPQYCSASRYEMIHIELNFKFTPFRYLNVIYFFNYF